MRIGPKGAQVITVLSGRLLTLHEYWSDAHAGLDAQPAASFGTGFDAQPAASFGTGLDA